MTEAAEKSRVEIEEADAPSVNWLPSGPVVGPDGKRRVYRNNVATGAIEEKVLGDEVKPEWGTYYKIARAQFEAGGAMRLPSKDFPHAPTREQELREEEEPAAKK
jgi:hypothetical protein